MEKEKGARGLITCMRVTMSYNKKISHLFWDNRMVAENRWREIKDGGSKYMGKESESLGGESESLGGEKAKAWGGESESLGRICVG